MLKEMSFLPIIFSLPDRPESKVPSDSLIVYFVISSFHLIVAFSLVVLESSVIFSMIGDCWDVSSQRASLSMMYL